MCLSATGRNAAAPPRPSCPAATSPHSSSTADRHAYSHQRLPADIRERAERVRLACFDFDGTLTDGRLGFDSDGREFKTFHVHDGQGLVLLRKAGIPWPS